MDRLARARTRCDELLREKSRLSGELDAANRRCEELEKKCSEEFECGSAELPALIVQMREAAEKSVAEAESVLGLGVA